MTKPKHLRLFGALLMLLVAMPAGTRSGAPPKLFARDKVSAAVGQQRPALTLEMVGQLGGPPTALVAGASHLYLAAGRSVVIGMAPAEDQFLAIAVSPPLPAGIQGLAMGNGWLYAAVGTAGIWALDVRDPRQPVWTGSAALPGTAHALAVGDGRVYVAAGRLGGLQVVDIADPSRPLRLGGLDTPGDALSVAVVGTTALVADGPLGLDVIDAADGAHLRREGSLPSGIAASAVVVQGTVAYVVDPNLGLRLLDVSAPRAVVELGSVRLESETLDLAVDEQTVHLVTRTPSLEPTTALWEVDVADPAAPQLRDNTLYSDRIADLTVWRGHLWLLGVYGDGSVLLRLRLGDGYTGWAGLLEIPGSVTNVRLAVDMPVAVLPNSRSIQLVDIADPARPIPLMYRSLSGFVAVRAGYVYSANILRQTASLEVRPLTAAGAGELVASVNIDLPSTTIVDLAVTRDQIVMAGGIEVVAIGLTDPVNPYPFPALRLPYPVTALVANAGLAVAAGGGRLMILDVGKQGQPALLAQLVGAGEDARPLALSGHRAAYRRSDGVVALVDLTNPAAPKAVGTLPGAVTALDFGEDLVFAARGAELAAYDITRLEAPVELAALDMPAPVRGIAVAGDHVLVGTFGAGLVVVAARRGPVLPTTTPSATPTVTNTPSLPGPTDTPMPSVTPAAKPTHRIFLPLLRSDAGG